MAGGKETPRQKMIGMMYLVLTALLALNVSAEVLEAFGNITRGIDDSIKVAEQSNANLYTMINQRVSSAGDDENAKLVGERSKKVSEIVANLNSELEALKKEIVETDADQTYEQYLNGTEDYPPLKLVDPKNIDVATMLLVEKGAKPKSGGEELMEKINQARTDLVDLFDGLAITKRDPDFQKSLSEKITLRADDDPDEKEVAKRDWEYKTFNSIPRGAAIALVTKYQNDLRNAESEVLKTMLDAISAGKIEIKDFVPVVKVRKSALAVGEELDAEIFLAAQIGGVTPSITVNGQEIEVDPATGRGTFKQKQNAQGTKSLPVGISVKNTKTGETKEYETAVEFDVFKAPAIISADKMNVVYEGLENPMSISVPGFEPSQINASMSPAGLGTLKKVSPGKYSVLIKKRDRKGVNINVSVKLPDGSTKSMGSQNFRTLKVPSPTPSLNGNQGGNMSTGAIKAVKVVSVTLENFVFEGIRYKVTSFDYIYKPARGNLIRNSANSQAIPNDLRAAFANAKRGDLLIISGINASAPGLGKVPVAGSLVFNIQ
jgi:gliding motility-associated protein GldM